jgi:hypothetical protein
VKANQDIPLLKPKEFQHRNRHLFPTLPALYRHIGRRNRNGMLETGAIVEAPTGQLLIDPVRFDEWLRGRADDAAARQSA